MRFYFVLLPVLLLSAFLIFVFLQPKTASELSPPDPLMERVSSGDVEAIRAMILRTEKVSQSPLPNYWLYKGALTGDAELVAEFEAKFRSLSEEHKKVEIQSITTSAASTELKDILLKRLAKIYPEGFKDASTSAPKGQ